MDKMAKALGKMPEAERVRIKLILQKIVGGKTRGLDIKKLKGREDIFRVRGGSWRVIYRFVGKNAMILAIERRNDNTYK